MTQREVIGMERLIFAARLALILSLFSMRAGAQQCACVGRHPEGANAFIAVDGTTYTSVSNPTVVGAATAVGVPYPHFNSCAAVSVTYGNGTTESCSDLCGKGDQLYAGPTGQSSAVINCEDDYYDQTLPIGPNNPIKTPLHSDPLPFYIDATAPTVAITQAPVDNSIVGISKPISFSGTLTTKAPGTIFLQSFPAAVSAAYVSSGSPGNYSGQWEIDIDTVSLYNFTQSHSGLTYSSGPTTLGFSASDAGGAPQIAYSSAALMFDDGTLPPGAVVNPSMARQIFIDGFPPVVTFDQGSTSAETIISPLPAISGTVTDNFQLGALYLGIQDISGSSPLYWNSSSGTFQTSTAVLVNIPIASGVGVASSSWAYSGFNNWTPGHTYLISAVAADSVNNVSTTAVTLSLLGVTRTSLPATASSVDLSGLIQFDQPAYSVQYGTYAAQSVCAHPNSSADPQLLPTGIDQIELADVTGAIINITPHPINSACPSGDYEWQIQSDPNQCIDSVDQLTAFFSNSIAATTQVTVLLPTAIQSEFVANVNGSFLPTPFCAEIYGKTPTVNCIQDVYAENFIGPPGMNLVQQQFVESITQSPYPGLMGCNSVLNGAGTSNLNPSPITGATINQSRDVLGYAVDRLFPTGSDGFARVLAPAQKVDRIEQGSLAAWTCGNTAIQSYRVNACRIPRAVPDVVQNIRLTFFSLPNNAIGASLRSGKSDETGPHPAHPGGL